MYCATFQAQTVTDNLERLYPDLRGADVYPWLSSKITFFDIPGISASSFFMSGRLCPVWDSHQKNISIILIGSFQRGSIARLSQPRMKYKSLAAADCAFISAKVSTV